MGTKLGPNTKELVESAKRDPCVYIGIVVGILLLIVIILMAVLIAQGSDRNVVYVDNPDAFANNSTALANVTDTINTNANETSTETETNTTPTDDEVVQPVEEEETTTPADETDTTPT